MIKFLFILSMDLAHFRHLILQLAIHQALRVLKAQTRSIRSIRALFQLEISDFTLTLEMLSRFSSTFEALDGAFFTASLLLSVIHHRQSLSWNIFFDYKLDILWIDNSITSELFSLIENIRAGFVSRRFRVFWTLKLGQQNTLFKFYWGNELNFTDNNFRRTRCILYFVNWIEEVWCLQK